MNQFNQKTANSETNDQGAFPGLDMDVARAGLDGVQDEIIHERANLDSLLIRERLKVTLCMIHKWP